MRGVILSAGKGSRLRPITSYIPKPLLPVGGKRIIDYVISYLSEACEEIIIVAGYMHELLEKYVGERYPEVKILKVKNLFPGNLYTLLRARDLLKEDFVVANADHIFPSEVWEFFPEGRRGVQVACHRRGTRKIFEDEMKVRVSAEKLIYMDKKLKDYEGAYTGLAYVGKDSVERFWRTAKEVFNRLKGEGKVEDVFNELARLGEVKVVWIDDVKFYEVDTVSDLRRTWYEKEAPHL